jgi:hypothetical protein
MRRTPKPRSDLSYVLTRRESARDEHKKAPAGRMGRTPGLLLADCIGAVTSSLPPASDLRPDHVGQGHERDVDYYPHGKEGEGEHHASSFIGRPWPTTRASARSSSVILPHCRSGSREYQLVPWRRSVARPPASLPGMAPLAWPYAERGAAALSKQVGERNAQGDGDLRELAHDGTQAGSNRRAGARSHGAYGEMRDARLKKMASYRYTRTGRQLEAASGASDPSKRSATQPFSDRA